MNTIVHVMESPSEFFEYARYDWKNDPHLGDDCRRHFDETEKDDDFHGNQEEVYAKFSKHNVKHEASLVNEVMDEFSTIDFDTVKWQYRMRLAEGDDIDVDRYLDGQEKFWSGVRKQHKTKKVLRVYTAIGGHCGRSERELAVNGAIAVTVAEILESMGVAVEIWGVSLTNGVDAAREKNILMMVKVKGADEYSDMGIINYITGDGKVFRNTCFRNWCKKLSEVGLDSIYSLGRVGEVDETLVKQFDDGTTDGTITIPHIYDVEVAKKWMVDTLIRNGGAKR